MVMLHAGTRFGGAARGFFNRHRVIVVAAVLSVVGVATGTATALSLLQNVYPTTAIVLGVGALLAAVFCLLQTRHVGLAALTASAPLPGLIWAASLNGASQFGAVPFMAYAIGLAVAVLQAQAMVERALGCRVESPWRSAAVAIGVMMPLGALWFWATQQRGAAIQSIADVALSSFSALLLLRVGSALLTYDESFVARANRAREQRQRIAERLALITTHRWALSVAGIALVFLALGWFGSEPVARNGNAGLALRAVSVAVVALSVGIFARSWREGLAVSLTGATAALLSLWFTIYGRPVADAAVCVLQAATLALFTAVVGVRQFVVHSVQGDAMPVARQRAVEDTVTGQVFLGAGAVIAVLPAVVVWPAFIPFAFGLATAAIAGTLFAPALATVFEIFLPRHHSSEHQYGARGKSKVGTVVRGRTT